MKLASLRALHMTSRESIASHEYHFLTPTEKIGPRIGR